MNADGLGHMDGTSVSAVLWLHGDPERMQILRDMRETMSPGQRARLNSPITARRRIEDILKARASGLEEAEKVSSVALLKQQLRERDRKIAELEQKLATQADGLLFDLKRDGVDDIAKTIIGNISEQKAKGIVAAIAANLETS